MMTSLLLGMLTVCRAFFPLCPSVDVPAVVGQVIVDDDLLGYQFYLVRFAPVAPPSSSAAG